MANTTTSLIPSAVGWHGKLPSRGDFVGRGMPRGWLRTWDDWLQRGLALAAQRWGTNLRDHLLAMPPWQAIVVPAQPGQPAWCIVVVASSDRVGRAFPLMVGEAHDAAVLDGVPLAAWHARALQLADWLDEARQRSSPRELDAGTAELAEQPWAITEPHSGMACIADLRARWGSAGSFWWRTGPDAEALAPLVQPWPPRESLVLDWLGDDDTAPPEPEAGVGEIGY